MSGDESSLRLRLEELWRNLAEEASQGRSLLSVDLPISADGLAVRLAIGPDGRHLLLPVQRGEERFLREDRRSSAVALLRHPLEIAGERRLYADVVCLRPELNGVFTALCSDILLRQEAYGGAPVSHAASALGEWRALFAGAGRQLTLQQLAGLFGELSILAALLRHNSHAARYWVGPDGNRHDFVWPARALEAKTTIASEGRKVRVHGLDQLEAPAESELFVVFQRLETAPSGGTTISELVERVCSMGEAAVILGRLELVGYRPQDAERYAHVTFNIVEELWFRVDSTLPRLVADSFVGGAPPRGIDEIHYTLDLAQTAPVHDPHTVDEILGEVAALP